MKQAPTKDDVSLLATLGLGSVEKKIQKLPYLGNAIIFLIINFLAATIFYYLCYAGLWVFSAAPQEEGQWFARWVDILGKSHTRYTTIAAKEIAYFIAGIAACLFAYANYSNKNKTHFLIKTVYVSLIPVGLLVFAKVFTAIPVNTPMGLIYGQFTAIVLVCINKLLGGNKIATNAKSKP
jgi:hypothetical protein